MMADIAAFDMRGLAHAGALHDPVAALIFGFPARASLTIVNGRIIVSEGELATLNLPSHIERHNQAARAIADGG